MGFMGTEPKLGGNFPKCSPVESCMDACGYRHIIAARMDGSNERFKCISFDVSHKKSVHVSNDYELYAEFTSNTLGFNKNEIEMIQVI